MFHQIKTTPIKRMSQPLKTQCQIQANQLIQITNKQNHQMIPKPKNPNHRPKITPPTKKAISRTKIMTICPVETSLVNRKMRIQSMTIRLKSRMRYLYRMKNKMMGRWIWIQRMLVWMKSQILSHPRKIFKPTSPKKMTIKLQNPTLQTPIKSNPIQQSHPTMKPRQARMPTKIFPETKTPITRMKLKTQTQASRRTMTTKVKVINLKMVARIQLVMLVSSLEMVLGRMRQTVMVLRMNLGRMK